MIQNDQEKEWMLPLLELRNELDLKDDRPLRDFRRMDGRVQLFHDGSIPGPYTQESREKWLRKLLAAQQWGREHGPEEVRDLELITIEELHEIRRIWLVDKHEIEDRLPIIFQESTGEVFPGAKPQFVLNQDLFDSLKEICGDDVLHYQMIRDLISIEKKFSSMTKRSGLLDELEKAIKRSFYGDRNDAIDYAREKQKQEQLVLGVYQDEKQDDYIETLIDEPRSAE